MIDAKALVVDDNGINRKVFKNLLNKYQIRVSEAESGEQCLNILEQEKFDIIFLDYLMPNMNGVETLRAIKAKNLCDGTPIVMLTANAAEGAKEEYMNEGFDDYMSKPIDLGELDKIIYTYLSIKSVPNNIQDKGINQEQKQINNINLPKVEGFDFSYALNILNSEDILLKTLEDFYHFIDSLPEKLSMLYDAISQEETRSLYRVEIHALKSTAATVGATALSKTAEMVEVAATYTDIDRISALHPILMKEIEAHRERISSIMPQEEDKVEMKNTDEIQSYLDMLKRSLENHDYDASDVICNAIKKYKYPTQIQWLVDKIINCVMNLDAEEALTLIAKLKEEV